MARTLRNLRVALGVIVSEKGIGQVEKKLRDLDQRLEKMDRVARGGAGLLALGGAASSFAAAVAPAAGAVVALPAALAAWKVSVGVAKVALVGLGDAMSAVAEGDAAALDQALSKLSPNARRFAREADRLFGSWTDLQRAVQDRAFAGLDRELRPVADSLLPGLRSGMLDVAAGFNRGAKEAAAFAQTPMARGTVNKTFASTSRIMGMLAGATQPALQVISQLTVKSLPLAERMAAWATNGVKAGAAFLTSERGAAALERTVDRAGDTVAQLGRIGGNTLRGLISMFGQAKSNGDGVLDSLEDMTARFERWSKSVEGQRDAAEVFRLMRDMAAEVVDVLPILLGPLGALVKLINGLPGPLKDGVLQFLAFAVVLGSITGRLRPLLTVVGAVGEAFTKADGPVQRLKDRIGGMGGSVGRARGALGSVAGLLAAGGPWGIAIAGGIAALGFFATRNDEAEARVQELTDALIRNEGALDDSAIANIKNRLETEGVYKAAQELGIRLDRVTEAALGNKAALVEVNRQLNDAASHVVAYGGRAGQSVTTQKQLAGSAKLVSDAISGQNDELTQSFEKYRRLEAATPGVAAGGVAVADSITDVGTAADKTSSKVNALNTRLAKFRALNGDADLAAIAFRDSLDDLSDAFGKNTIKINERTGKIDINNKAGREANRVLIDSIQSAIDHADKVKTQTNSVDKANKVFHTEIGRLRGVLEQSNLSKEAIDKLIARYATMPGQINSATDKIRDRTVRIEVKAGGKLVGYKVQGGTIPVYATGGILPGYTPGRDVHLFTSPTGGALGLSGGEAVMRPEWTRAVGPEAVEKMNAAARRGGVSGVRRVLAAGVGPQRMGGEGAFFASGGILTKTGVSGLASVQAMAAKANTLYGQWASRIGGDVSKLVRYRWMGGPGAARALAWARTQAGKPYIWGGVGPRGYDCSGFISAITNVIKGRSPYSRLFTTHSFGAKSGPGGFVRNLSSGFRVGVTDAGVGHMAGTLGGVNVESRGSAGVLVGSAARGAGNGLFTRRYGLKFDEGGVMPPGAGAYYNGTRKPEYVFTDRQMQRMGGDTYNITVTVPPTADPASVGAEVYKALKAYKKKSFGKRSMDL